MSFFEKVAVIGFRGNSRQSFLAIQHPTAGLQLPAGSVEPGEQPDAAASREFMEETGIAAISNLREIATIDEDLRGSAITKTAIDLFDDPSFTKSSQHRIPRGFRVQILQSLREAINVRYTEWLFKASAQEPSWSVEGWTERGFIEARLLRHLYVCDVPDISANHWMHAMDGHLSELGWYDVEMHPPLIPPQDRWLEEAIHFRQAAI